LITGFQVGVAKPIRAAFEALRESAKADLAAGNLGGASKFWLEAAGVEDDRQMPIEDQRCGATAA
jgi:hypothetical protein